MKVSSLDLGGRTFGVATRSPSWVGEVGQKDVWVWKPDSVGGFLVKGSYD